jgi:type VI secretion system protein VasI
MDDTTTVGIWARSNDSVTSMLGRPVTPKITILCRNDETQAYVDIGGPFAQETRSWEGESSYGYTTGIPLRLRVDHDPPIPNFGAASNDQTSAFFSSPIPVLKKMFGHDKLLVEYTPMGDGPKTIEFGITGLAEAIDPVRKACKW